MDITIKLGHLNDFFKCDGGVKLYKEGSYEKVYLNDVDEGLGDTFRTQSDIVSFDNERVRACVSFTHESYDVMSTVTYNIDLGRCLDVSMYECDNHYSDRLEVLTEDGEYVAGLGVFAYTDDDDNLLVSVEDHGFLKSPSDITVRSEFEIYDSRDCLVSDAPNRIAALKEQCPLKGSWIDHIELKMRAGKDGHCRITLYSHKCCECIQERVTITE